MMEHAEGTTRFTTNDNHALRNKLGKTYTYKMEDNRLVLLIRIRNKIESL
ncbi:hypothetical protein [Enterococcus hirae]|nr:hypothetical protein [Enterococcus hirae]